MRITRDQILGCSLVMQLSITLVVAVLIPVLLGIWLDRSLHTSPFITLFMMLLGITLGSVAVYRNIAGAYKRVTGDKS